MHGTLRIGRLRADCHVTGSPEALGTVGDRATRALRDHLPIALRGRLAPLLDGGDECVWIVRRLDVSVAVSTDTAADDLASLTATSIRCALDDALRDDGDGVNAIRFANAATYLARFVADVATGDPWRRWYYAPLAGWKLLPASAAIRSALTQDPERGRAVLASLGDETLLAVAGALTALDERAVLASLTRLPADVFRSSIATFDAALLGCSRALAAGAVTGHMLFAVVRSLTSATSSLVTAVEAIFEGAGVVQRSNRATSRQASVEAILRAGLEDEFGEEELTSAARRVITLASARSSTAPADGHTDDGSASLTRFGGLSLLLRDLYALPWESWTSGWPTLFGAPSSAVCRWLVLALCTGRDRTADVLADSVWRTLVGIPHEITQQDVAAWAASVGAVRWRELSRAVPIASLARAQRTWFSFPSSIGAGGGSALPRVAGLVLVRFAGRLPGFAESTPDFLWRNILAFDADVTSDTDRVIVSCGRPPLHLILTLTGMTRGLDAGRAADGRPIVVFSRG